MLTDPFVVAAATASAIAGWSALYGP